MISAGTNTPCLAVSELLCW